MCDLLWLTNVSQSYKAERGTKALFLYGLHANRLFTVLRRHI